MQQRPRSIDADGHQPISATLGAVIDDAYKVFSDIAPGAHPPTGGQRAASALGQDLCSVQLDQVWSWLASASERSGPGAIMQLRWCLPRILQAIATHEQSPGRKYVRSLDDFPLGDETMWRRAEWSVLSRFCEAFLDQLVPNEEVLLDDALCLLVRAGVSAERLFKQVSDWPPERLTEQLFHDWCQMGLHSILIGDDWPPDTMAITFYASDALYDQLIEFGTSAETPNDIAGRALQLAGVIDSSDYFNRLRVVK